MKYIDRVYGGVEITEPIILDLIHSPSLQRLKGIDQHGYFEPHFPGTAYSRFEHSLGVYYLLKRFGASLEEQVAGLIHDTSHAVFSHCTDYVLGTDSKKVQTHQDEVFEEFVRKSEMLGILEKHGLEVDFILDEKNFPLKERDLPDLCADRIDYCLRDGLSQGMVEKEQVREFLNCLTIKDGLWVFKDFIRAKRFAEVFAEMNRVFWAGLPSAIMFQTVADCLRYTLQKGYLSKDDLYTTDEEVLSKIRMNLNSDDQLGYLFERMNNRIKCENNSGNFEAKVVCKSRAVDPLCWHEGKVQRVSEIDRGWIEILEKESQPKEYFLKFH